MVLFCGPKISNCCFVLSIWGIIMLVNWDFSLILICFLKLFLGVFFQTKSVALREDVNDEKDYRNTSRNCFIAAGLYVVTLIIAGHQKWANQRKSSSKLPTYQMSRLE